MAYEALSKQLKKGDIKACVIQQHAEITFEYYKNQRVQTALHPINSCSKSITSMLIGICIRDNLINDIQTPISEYFKDYFSNENDREKANITIFNLLTMTSGIDWPEFGEWNYWSPMEFSKDIVKSALERKLADKPGTKMNYNSGSSNLLSAIIQKASGMRTVDFAYKYLFSPLGIEEVQWHEKQGISLGANGLKMKPLDLLKLGQLYLHDGCWNGAQIVQKEWVLESTQPRFITYPDIGHYGYQWWMSDFVCDGESKVSFYFALGLFGQFIIVVPKYEMVVVFFSENYSDTMKPMGFFREYIVGTNP